ncbi:hypothetical protein SLS56_008642 [Neofusicoccum ribis]|uniref:Myb-like domain-containing protein n=2 Tax=Neofusicoccum TaxID=407951 RepID=A0ABR3SJK0_9PEZI
MSTSFGSSAINKSGKKFAPKVARRRPAAVTGSDAASATSSAEQTPTSTPVPSATPANETVQSEGQNVLPTPPSTQGPPQPPSTYPAATGQSVPSAQQTPVNVPTVTPHRDDLEAGGRSPKRRRIAPPANTQIVSVEARSPGSLEVSRNAAPSVVISPLVEQAAANNGRAVSVGLSQEATSITQDNAAQATTSDPVSQAEGQTSAESAATTTAPKSKKVTQPKAVRRRGAARLSNQDLIREVMGENTGVTKPSTHVTVVEEHPVRGELQPRTGLEGSQIVEQTATQVQDEAEVPINASAPTRASKRAPNVAAAKRRRQQAAPSPSTEQPATEQHETSQLAVPDTVAAVEGALDVNGTTHTAATKKPRQPRPKKRAAQDAQNAGEGSSGDVQVAKPKRTRKKPKTPARVTDDDAEERPADAEVAEDADGEQSAAARKRPRALSEHLIFDDEDRENPEKTRINAVSMPMSMLTRDVPMVGTISHREEALSKIDWDEEKRKRIEERERIALGEEVAQTQAEREAALARLQEAANSSSVAAQAPRMRVVNGVMTLDTMSTQVDRNARAREDAEELQEVEEDELTTRVNSMSWIKANRKDPRERTTWGPTRADRWSDEQTEMFYDALKMFGTDFFIISKMFPGKTRANVKRKFVKEERLDADRVKRALIGESVPMDFEEYKRKTGKDDDFFRDPEQLRQELELETEQQKQEVEEAQARYAEQQRQRKLAKQGGADVDGEEGEGGASGKKGKKKKGEGKKGKKGKVPIGGEEIEVVEFDGDELEHRR